MNQNKWFVYILRCKDNSMYTGITDNLKRRLSQHREGKGAKYTRGRAPLTLHHIEEYETKGEALRRELEIKRLTTAEKRALISEEPLSEADL